MKTFHVVTIILNAYLGPTKNKLIHGSHNAKEEPRPGYLEKRGRILSKLTLKSLAHQTTQDFHVIVLHDDRLDARPYVPVTHLPDDRLHFVGIKPVDFKRDLSRGFWRPRAPEDEKIYELAGDADRLLITHIDSDDCYRYDAMARYREMEEGPGCIMMREGFIHHVGTGDVGKYRSPAPPFYTLVYEDMERFRAGKRWQGGAGHHSFVPQKIPTRFIVEPMYMVNVHGANDSTRWRVSPRDKVAPDKVAEIRSQFGVTDDAEALA